MTNETMIENLNNLIAGDTIERYFAPFCIECETPVITTEAKRIAAEHKATAARIVIALTATDNSSAWAVETKDTAFDSPEAAVIRGELENTPDAPMRWTLNRMGGGKPFFTGNETVPTGDVRDGWGKSSADYRAERLKAGRHYEHHPECQNKPVEA